MHDYIEYLIKDPRVSAIGLHIEGIENVHEFSIAALKALEAGIPIVAIKTGRSVRGAEINMSHTASLAGEDRLYDALFDRFGIARCDSVVQFLETLKFLSTVGTLQANTVGSMSCSGGEASLIADYSDDGKICDVGVRDEMFGAVQYPVIAVWLRCRLHAPQVGAGSRFRHRQAIPFLSRNAGLQVPFPLLRGASAENV